VSYNPKISRLLLLTLVEMDVRNNLQSRQ
jgi:hypothetical protein